MRTLQLLAFYFTKFIHGLVWLANIVAVMLLVYVLLANLGLWAELENQPQPYVSFPVLVGLVRMGFGNRCPLTLLENKLLGKVKPSCNCKTKPQ